MVVTAGASAPNPWCRAWSTTSEQQFSASVEVGIVREEDVHFPLPRELRQLGI